MRYAEYALHYRKTIGDIRIEFYRGFNSGVPSVKEKEIGNVLTNLSFQIQGEQGDIDTPIVKTSLAISMNDASDLTDGNINGPWDFFAQGTETEWMVQICREADDLILWSGFVTPDSYSEELRYRGVCSIIARDNIGQLQNYDFDAEGNADGLISLVNLVSAAWSKVGNGMRLTWASDAMWLSTELGTPARYTMMNVSAFEDMSWYEALESALYAYGAVLRYAGNNTFVVCPIKWLPTLGQMYENVTWMNPLLMAGASLEYAPAAKKIEEGVKYEIEESKPIPLVTDGEYSGAIVNTEYEGKTVFGETIKGQAPVWPLTKTMYELGWSNPIANAPLLLNAKKYSISAFEKQYLTSDMLFLTNTNGANEVVYTTEINAENFNLRMSFGSCFELNNSKHLDISYGSTLSKLIYGISASQGDSVKYWNGSNWVTEQIKLEADFDKGGVELPCPLHTFSGSVTFRLHIFSIVRTNEISTEEAAYASLTSIEVTPNNAIALRSVNCVVTNYNEYSNLILHRSPKLGPTFEHTLFPSFIKNGIFDMYDGKVEPTPKWVIAYDYDNDVEVVSQLAAGIHMQILPYFTKPNRVINATIPNKNLIDYNPLYVWEGREYLLMSGTYNLLNGNIDGAVLREFARYNDIWQGATLPDIKEESTKN